ncbi:MAG TPA: hypothetical protein VHE56_08885 [Mycobacteriales bacterium]|nr:hypothetical protein [Mycobacteriales bacterium]
MRRRAPVTVVATLAVALSIGVLGVPPTVATATPSHHAKHHHHNYRHHADKYAGRASLADCTEKYGVTSSRSDSWSATEPLTRKFGDGTPDATNCIHLQVNKHTNLQDHERIKVTWSGAHPTAGRAINPYGETGLEQEYPVLLMECRGVDPKNDAGTAARQTVSPDTCWTNTYFERTSSADPGQGIWQQEADATDADKAHLSGIDPANIPEDCNVSDTFDYHITPFLAKNGTLYGGCSSQSMPPEATVDSVSIPNEAAAFTNLQGDGLFEFDPRTNLDNASLGCSFSVPCTLEVIPIDGVNCADPDPDATCNATGQLPAGQVNPGSAPQDAVAPAFWWSASNWERRIPVPLTFAPPPSVCQSASAGKPVPFYGSELLSQAALQWTPAYCQNKKRFNWQDNIMPDQAANALLGNGQAAAAEVSTRQENDDRVGYAPTAVTGWGIGFDIDKPGNAGQQLSINLNARLIAKLLTESYPGSVAVQQSHPGFSHNPLSLNLDPEFIKLNPGLDTAHWSEAAGALMSLSTSSGVITQLTSYIAADPQAMAFIHGKPSPGGMRVNPFYKDVKLPVSTWPLLDTWVNKTTNNPCLHAAPTAYMPLTASPVSSLRLIATALLYSWPMVATGCTGNGTPTSPFQLARSAPQGLGNRFILGLVTLGDAKRYDLTVAKLQASPNHFVAAGDAGMRAALKLAEPGPKLKPFRLPQRAIRKSKTAYPGTTIVYTAAKTSGLSKSVAADVSQFIKISATEGQVRGRANGQLAEGYLPISKSGVTARLYQQALQVATAVAKQQPPPAPSAPAGTGGSAGTSGPPAGPTVPLPSNGASTPGAVPTPQVAGDGSTSSEPRTRTAALSSPVGGSLLPALLLLGLVAGLAAGGSRFWLRLKGLK